ncbi:MAG TPA: citrate synthase [Candidatus Hydrogenedentes bacterium]|jgi:citrate synthase|nr:MAG: Citrate synthase 1 [Candidatus Hydrogenedentes bacterium ADurb.Bin170]HNZ47681.1 citrate synthase [Candidatus Hydrogenedentota bacterium]HOD95509.1 citrate synthase [Candidatus Hydrogenedentota bacterium]HOR50964.1 citrate synthase [Candidatus Hydrogenedentota bacterium]HPK24856.1 citrate synthase [Candidatus Hydrogenedentota bacterium]
MTTAKLIYNGQEYDIPVIVGTENEGALDIRKLRDTTGLITYDPGYANTGSCQSAITFIDGDRGILRYRGYPIEELAGSVRFSAAAYLMIYGRMPSEAEFMEWRKQLTLNSLIHASQVNFFDNYSAHAHPMNILSAMVSSISSFYPHIGGENDNMDQHIQRLIGQVKTIAAFSYRKSVGLPYIYPRTDHSYSANFLRMMFASPAEEYVVPKVMENALDMLLILHMDHEQNCSTSTVRMVASSMSNIYASVSAGINALWGRLHGGANEAVLNMLQRIADDGSDYKKYVELAKRKDDPFKLMGFGHRVYKNFDPRSKILKKAVDDVLTEMGIQDPLLDIAKNLEEVALKDDFFIERKLYPNVDFYSGILYRALGIPTEMFTVLFAIGRMPGWIAHWLEMSKDPDLRIQRPRQVYIGENLRHYEKTIYP